MPNLATSRLKSSCAALTVCVLAAVVVPIAASFPATAQDWIVNDNPELLDLDTSNSFRWNTPPDNVNRQGYGSNGFKYSYARARPGNADTYARWQMGSLDGTYEIQVWIPGEYATAHVRYHIYQDLPSGGGRSGESWLDQEAISVSGWQSLGEYQFFGGSITISVADSATRDHYDRDSPAATRLAVDALRMQPVGSGDQPATPPPPPSRAPGPPRNLSLAMTDSDSFQISWNPPSDDGGSPITNYGVAVQNVGSGDIAGWFTTATSTSFDGVVGATYTVEVWAKNSQGNGSAQRAQITIPSTGNVPGPPRNLSLTRTGSDGVRIRWAPPADDGGSRIIRYSLSTWRPDGSTNSWTTTNTEYHLGVETDVFYTVSVVAENRHGPSIPVRQSIYIEADTPQPPVEQDDPVPPTMDDPVRESQASTPSAPRNLRLTLIDADSFRITWDPPSSDGGSPVTGYTLEVSRPRLSASVGPWRDTFVPRGTSFRFDGRKGATYSVRISAKNRVGTGRSAGGEIATAAGHPPGVPRNVRVEPHRQRTVVSWDRPVDGGDPNTYTVTYERERLSSTIGPWKRSFTVNGNTTSHTLGSDRGDVEYGVTVVAHNTYGTSPKLIGRFTTVGRYAHEPVDRIPEMQNSEKDEVPLVPGRYSGDWNKEGYGGGTGPACGAFGGCAEKDGFWHTRIMRRDGFAPTYVYWDDFGNQSLRGTYSVEFFLPERGARQQDGSNTSFTASAIAKYTIEERRPGSDDWRTVGYFTVDQGKFRGLHDTRDLSLSMTNATERAAASFETRGYDYRTLSYRHTGGRWALEGDVRIKLQGKNGALAADSVRLVQRDLLQIDKDLAIGRCQANVLNVVTKLGWIGVAVDIVLDLAGSVALSLATAGIASTLAAGGLAVQLTRGITITGKVVDLVKGLLRVLEVGRWIYDGARSPWAVYSNIKSWAKLWEQVYLEIFEQLTGDHRENFERFNSACNRRDGVAWSDSGQTIGLTQAFVRSGYLDYLEPDAVS